MSRVFTSRLDIDGNAGTANPLVFELYAKVIDMSLAGYSNADVLVGDLVYDENLMTGDHNRWRVTSIIARGSNAYPGADWSSIKAQVTWDDQGDVDSNGPAAGSGAICRSTSKGLSESPNQSMHGISEPLGVRLRNIDNRVAINPNLGGSSSSGSGNLIKQMQNGHSADIPAGKPVSKLANGKIVPADSDAANGQKYIGITKQAIIREDLGDVYLVGNNVPGALASSGFTPGQDVFISETEGVYTNDPNSFTGNNDSIIKVGIADCAAGVASGTAIDLIMFSEVVLRP